MNDYLKKTHDTLASDFGTVIRFKKRKNKYDAMKYKDIEMYKRHFNSYFLTQKS